MGGGSGELAGCGSHTPPPPARAGHSTREAATGRTMRHGRGAPSLAAAHLVVALAVARAAWAGGLDGQPLWNPTPGIEQWCRANSNPLQNPYSTHALKLPCRTWEYPDSSARTSCGVGVGGGAGPRNRLPPPVPPVPLRSSRRLATPRLHALSQPATSMQRACPSPTPQSTPPHQNPPPLTSLRAPDPPDPGPPDPDPPPRPTHHPDHGPPPWPTHHPDPP